MAGRKPKTCEQLGLNVADAMEKGAWLLLPEYARTLDKAKFFPIPWSRVELARLMRIEFPQDAADPSCAYLRRAQTRWFGRMRQAEPGRPRGEEAPSAGSIKKAREDVKKHINATLEEIAVSAAKVHEVAEKVTTTLTDLYDLCRESLEGQLRAHLAGSTWRGEPINSRAARECFRLVTQAVKGFGIPREGDRAAATKISMEETAAAIRETKEALTLAPSQKDDETLN